MKAAEKERENEIKQLSTPRLMKYNDRNNSDSAGDRSNSDDMTMVYNDRNNSGSDCSNSDSKIDFNSFREKQTDRQTKEVRQERSLIMKIPSGFKNIGERNNSHSR